MIVSVLLRGWALAILWGWFVVPIFELPSLTIAEAIGISMIMSFLTHTTELKTDDQKTGDYIVRTVSLAIMHPIFAVLAGLVVVQFM